MVYTGPFPPTSIYGTWVEAVEIWDIDTDTLLDLSSVTEVTVKVRDQLSKVDELILTMSGGDITIPGDGVVQWRVEVGTMGTLPTKLYEIILILEDSTDTVPIVIGNISIVE